MREDHEAASPSVVDHRQGKSVFGSIGRGERHLEGVSPSLSALAPSFSRRANVAMMPAHFARLGARGVCPSGFMR